MLQSFNVQPISQTVTFGAQSAKTFSANGTFAINPLAFASSELPITYISQTSSVCTANGAIITMVTSGTCTIRATQAGDSVTALEFKDQSIAINPPPSPGLPRLITPRLPDATLNRPYSANIMLSATSAVTGATVSGLPTGLTAAHNGSGSIVLAGTPTQGGNFTLTVNATNAIGPSVAALTLTVIDTAAYANNVARISAGGGHSCAVVNGGVQCWGFNGNGQLGNGGTASKMIPVQAIAPGSGAIAVSAGDSHTCAVVKGGVKCWGNNANGKLGNNSTVQSTVPVIAIAEGSRATVVTAGFSHSCAVVDEGVQCWGSNANGELGTSDTVPSLIPVQVIPAMSGLHPAVAAGNAFTCVVRNGGVQCWGINNAGQLGDGSVMAQNTNPAQTILPGSGVTSVSAGSGHACALRSGGVQCWGYNYYGQLGNASNANINTPLQTIAASSGVTSISAGGLHTCAVMLGGVQCWGNNGNGELGIATNQPNYVPAQAIPAGSNASAVAGGGTHTCALVGGAVQCWGNNSAGQLGNPGVGKIETVPLQAIATGSSVSGIAANMGSTYSCAVVNGGVQCWGDNSYGQLGNSSNTSSISPVQAIAAGSNVIAVSTGNAHTCAVANSAAKCWGRANEYQLGDNTGSNHNSPAQVSGLTSGVSGISAGYEHACAVVNGGAQCWGKNQNGQLGDNSQSQPLSPVQVSTLPPSSGVTAVAAGSIHSCAVVNGGVKCWGNNFNNQLGDGSNTQRLAPVQVVGLIAGSGVTALSAGTDLTCAIANGGVPCWGGSDSVEIYGLTQLFAAGSGATAVAVGRFHLCAVISGGVQCLGLNAGGQLGNGSTTDSLIPVQAIVAGSGVTAVSAGLAHTCAVVSGGSVCWGRSDSGQLGDAAFYPFGKKVSAAVQIVLIPQVLSFNAPASKLTTDAPFAISATGGSSGNQVVFTSQTPAICATTGANGSTITLTAAVGTCTIAANQAGSINYIAATQVSQSFNVATPPSFFVTPATGANGSISPSSVQTVTQGGTASFTVTANNGYVATIGGTCVGTLSGNVFTTNPVLVDCSVNAAFTLIPPTAPGAPVIGVASAGDGEATVAFSPPASSGASVIAYYTATCLPGGSSAANTASPILVGGLINGTTYTCSITATNATVTGAASAASNLVTPIAPQSATLWINNCSGCHGALPSGTQLNAAGTTATVLSRVIATQGTMVLVPSLAALTAADRAAIAAYIAQQVPVIAVSTPSNTAKTIDVASHITLNAISFNSVQAVSGPASGTLSAFTGTSITYTPNAGFSGTDTFTYRGVQSSPSQLGDPRTVTITVSAQPALKLVGVQSRKIHGVMGPFDLPVDFSVPISGAITIEPRVIGTGHTLVFNFVGSVSSVSGVTARDATLNSVGTVSAVPSGNDVVVTLTGVSDKTRVTVALTQVNGAASTAAASIGFLIGNVSGSQSVNAIDVSRIKARAGRGVDAMNFQFDLNASGGINAADISAVKARSGFVLP